MVNRRTFVLPVIDQKESLGVKGIVCNFLVSNGLLLNGTPFNDDIVGYGRMHVHIHKEAKEPVRGFFIFFPTVIVMMVLAGMCYIRMGMGIRVLMV